MSAADKLLSCPVMEGMKRGQEGGEFGLSREGTGYTFLLCARGVRQAFFFRIVRVVQQTLVPDACALREFATLRCRSLSSLILRLFFFSSIFGQPRV